MSSALDIALSGLRAAQMGIDVSSHNISNVNTEGYTRARLDLAAVPTTICGGALIGGGVQVASVQRIADQFVNTQIRNQSSQLGFYDQMTATLTQMETVLNESQDQGLGHSLNEFFSALSSVAANPESFGQRSTAINSAQLLAAKFQSLHQQLTLISQQNTQQLNYTVDQLNSNLDQLANLNGKIASGAQLGDSLGSLQDERDRVLNEVCKALNVQTYVNQDDGSASVSIDGMSLLIGESAIHLTASASGIYAEGSTTPFNVTSGTLGAMLKLRDTTIPQYLDDLDDLAGAIITNFNSVHSGNQGLDGSTGLDLFTGTGSNDIAVNTVIVADPNKLAASGDGTSGDNTGVEALLALRDQNLIAGTTLESYEANIAGAIGSEVQSASGYQTTVTDIMTQLLNQRDSVSGVSLDEEMTNLIKFQQAYNASARVINIISEMMDTMLTIGR